MPFLQPFHLEHPTTEPSALPYMKHSWHVKITWMTMLKYFVQYTYTSKIETTSTTALIPFSKKRIIPWRYWSTQYWNIQSDNQILHFTVNLTLLQEGHKYYYLRVRTLWLWVFLNKVKWQNTYVTLIYSISKLWDVIK